MAETQSKVYNFTNSGLVQKVDPGFLQDGQYAELTNFISETEGTLKTRYGNRRIVTPSIPPLQPGSWGRQPNLIHSIGKLRIGDNDENNYWYIGEPEYIWRAQGIEPPLDFGPSQVALGCASPTAQYPKQSFSLVQYNAGAVGKPNAFFATPLKMLKDDGTFGPANAVNSTLQKWGILPPTRPVTATPDKLTLLPAGIDMISEAAGSADRLSPAPTIVSVDTTASGASPTFPRIQCAMDGILAGMLIQVSDGVTTRLTVVQVTTKDYFQAYFETLPGVGDEITSKELALPGEDGLPGGLYADAAFDASFDGVAKSHFDTDDHVHIAVKMDDPRNFADIRFRVYVGGNDSDYYEKSIEPSSLTAMANQTETATTALDTFTDEVASAIQGEFPIPEVTAQTAKPAHATVSAGAGVWSEIDIPKSQFLKVGNAGEALATWQNVTNFQVVYTLAEGIADAAGRLTIGSIVISGGFGPNSQPNDFSQLFTPYDYLYCFRNPDTGQESNPCVPMIPDNHLRVKRQRVQLVLGGTDDPQVPVGRDNTIAVYRRGGAYVDGFYRFIGWAINPGAGSVGFDTTVLFEDSASDPAIKLAKILEFDNDAPVTSTLPVPFRAYWGGYFDGTDGRAGTLAHFNVLVKSAPQIVDPTTGGLVAIGTYLRPGSLLTIRANSSKQEAARIMRVGTGDDDPNNLGILGLEVFFQFDHSDIASNPAEAVDFVACDAVTGQPARFAATVGTSIFLAGDSNNPHVLYQSKSDRPESFPVVLDSSRIAHQQNVGSPADPIMNITEFNGQIACLNRNHIFVVNLWLGAMQPPVETPAHRGLVASHAWCKVENEIWYLGYDGIYSWAGGLAVKRSEAIDWMFKNKTVGEITPIDMSEEGDDPKVNRITMGYQGNEVFVIYVDTASVYHRLRYHTLYNRWSIDDIYDPISEVQAPVALTAMFVEPDTGRHLLAKSVVAQSGVSSGTFGLLYEDGIGTSEGWVDTEAQGGNIRFAAKGAAYTLGAPAVNKQFQDWMLEVTNELAGVNVDVFYDFTGADAVDSIQILQSNSAVRVRTLRSLQNGFGKEAYACQLRFSGETATPVTLHSLTWNFIPLAQIQVGRAFDWDDLGWAGDKRLYELEIEYDPGLVQGQTVVLNLDTLTGLPGAQQVNLSVQTFDLTPVTGASGTPARAKLFFPINDGVIVKMVRLRPDVMPAAFQIWKYSFIKEQYPPDIVYFSEWSDYGYAYDKHAQQVVLDVDTGGVEATIRLYKDGDVSPIQTLTVTTSHGDRNRNLTLKPNLTGKKFRMLFTPGTGGKFQLFNQTIIFQRADKGPVEHTFDFDDLGWPWDKRLRVVTIEYDAVSTGPFTIQMDTVNGIGGFTHNSNVQQFTLSGTGRSKANFPINDGVIAKLVRLYPLGTTVVFKEWKYQFDFEQYPADIVPWTESSDLEYPCEKILRALLLDVDTGGVQAEIDLESDGVLFETLRINSSANDRGRILTTISDLIGIRFRMVNRPGAGGKFQLFKYRFESIKEPCALIHWDSYEQSFGYNGFKIVKQMWIEYLSCVPIVVYVYVDDKRLLYSTTLPTHSKRRVERFSLPAFTAASPNILNKSRVYRIVVDAEDGQTAFKIYADSTRLEVLPLSNDQRTSYMQFPLTETMPIPI